MSLIEHTDARQSSAQHSISPLSEEVAKSHVLNAVLRLLGSERGYSAMRDLLTMLDGDSVVDLDESNQRAFLTLLGYFWGELPIFTRDLMREALATGAVSVRTMEGGAL